MQEWCARGRKEAGSGDNPLVAAAVAKAIGVEHFEAGLLPEQKQEFVKKLQAGTGKTPLV